MFKQVNEVSLENHRYWVLNLICQILNLSNWDFTLMLGKRRRPFYLDLSLECSLESKQGKSFVKVCNDLKGA